LKEVGMKRFRVRAVSSVGGVYEAGTFEADTEREAKIKAIEYYLRRGVLNVFGGARAEIEEAPAWWRDVNCD
jgi:hypothetical protein